MIIFAFISTNSNGRSEKKIISEFAKPHTKLSSQQWNSERPFCRTIVYCLMQAVRSLALWISSFSHLCEMLSVDAVETKSKYHKRVLVPLLFNRYVLVLVLVCETSDFWLSLSTRRNNVWPQIDYNLHDDLFVIVISDSIPERPRMVYHQQISAQHHISGCLCFGETYWKRFFVFYL